MELVDSAMSFEEAVEGSKAPVAILVSLTLVDVRYISFDGLLHKGQLVVHRDLEDDVRARFEDLLASNFPIEKVIPIIKYGWDDEASMQDNNTSCFNYRAIYPITRISNHSYGRAIDINPKLNPCLASNGVIQPLGAVYDVTKPGTFVNGNEAVNIFIFNGWTWGGSWTRPDWQHFEKDTQPL